MGVGGVEGLGMYVQYVRCIRRFYCTVHDVPLAPLTLMVPGWSSNGWMD